MPDQPDLAALVRRLEALEAEKAILETLYAYGHSIDYGDEDTWVNCFTEDGTWGAADREPIRGQSALRAFFPTHTHAPELYHKHLLIEPRIVVDGDRARCESYWTLLVADGDLPVLAGFGRYRDRLARGDDGTWRFEERIFDIESRDPRIQRLSRGLRS
jgi:ketosteroid isomerase-like protein